MILRDTNIRKTLRHKQRGFLLNPSRFGSSSGDPYFSNVVLLLHGEGANGSIVITDSSPVPKVATIGGATAISTTTPKFGTSSIGLTGVNADYFQYAGSTLALGTGDFTIEFFIWCNSFSSNPCLIDNRVVAPTSSMVIYMLSSNGQWRFFANGSDRAVSIATAANSWNHIAWSKSANVSKFWLNGAQQGADYADTNNYDHVTFRFGNNSSSTNAVNGRFDEVRVTKGVGRYPTPFSVPASAFPNF